MSLDLPFARPRARTRSLRALAIALAGLGLGATAASAEEEPTPDELEPTWYAQAMARGAAGLNVTHFWSKGPRLRAETVVAGHKIITIVHGDWYYAYDDLTKRGVAIKRDPASIANDRPGKRPFGNEYDIMVGQGAEMIREEEVMGRKAGVYRVTDHLGKRELWVTLDTARIPLRLEIYDRKTSRRRYTDYINWQSNLYIPERFFAPDESIELDRMDFEEYLARSLREGTVGPVPVLYTNLLHLKRDE